jgi:CHAT domain-containing protein
MRLDSVKLVVLSACEAGNGRLVKGEGVISLARAFAYAGCHNVLTTLWKAEDQATAFIATSVHEYLRQGYRKDEALRQAKLDYLAQDLHPVLKSPRYWANFIFIGDPSPIYQPTAWWLYVLAGSLALALVVFLLKKFFF